MRIVHVIDYFQPMLGYQETFLPKIQTEMGHDVYVVTSDRYSPGLFKGNATAAVLGKRVKESGLFIEEGIKTYRTKGFFEVPHEIWLNNLENLVLALEPDVIHVHGIVNFSAIRIALLKLKSNKFKLIYDDHMTFGASRSKLRYLYPFFKLTFAKLIYKSADALIGVSNTSKAFMVEKYGFPSKRVDVIPLAADITLFKRDTQVREALRQQLGLTDEDTLYIYAGKIVPEKGTHILAQATALLAKTNPYIKVLILGNGPNEYVQKIKEYISKENIENKFFWMDPVPNRNLYKPYSAADVAVWPREASLSMMEAMACNLPIIISDTSEVSERLEFNNGLLYHNEDPIDLAKQMERLIDRKLRDEMGSRGRKLVEEKLNWNVVATQFIESVEVDIR